MANSEVTVTVKVDGMDVTLKLLEEVRKSAFMAGYRWLADVNLEDEFFAEEAEKAYKEWVESLE